MLDLGLRIFQFLSVVLLILLVWSPRQPVFLAAVLLGLLRSAFADPSNPAQYIPWDALTTASRLLACLEAFWLRTGDVTRRWLLFALCLSLAAFTGSLLTLAHVRESVISEYNQARMVSYYAGAAFLMTLVAYSSFVPLQRQYRRDHWHVILLGLFCLVVGFSESVPMPMNEAGYERWKLVAGVSYLAVDAVMLGWVITCGHLAVAQQLVKRLLHFGGMRFQ